MENSKMLSNMRNMMYSGKHALLPPKSPFHGGSSSYAADYFPNPIIGSRAVQNPREGNVQHHRTSSESLLMEEQPSWLDDLLDEPETPVQRGGHRRSSSDSFAYLDAVNISNKNYTQDDSQCKNMSLPSWSSQDFDSRKDPHQASFYMKASWIKQKNRTRELPPTTFTTNQCARPSVKSSILLESSRPISIPQETNGFSPTTEKQDSAETGLQDSKSSERIDSPHVKPAPAETDNKRAKQQFAQRSRVRKLQYIAELERNVKALQAEGSEVSAELEFLSQQNLILGMENKALKQRLETVSQEQLIKYFEHEVLEREIGRLRMLYQQQQQPQPPPSSLKRSKSRDLETQFAKLSLRQKDGHSGPESVAGPVQI